MKQFAIICLLISLSVAVVGQKCKLLDPKVDSFTGEKLIQTRYNIMFGYDKENLDGGIVLNFGIIKKVTKTDTTLILTFMVMPKFYVKITPENKVDIKFDDGSVLSLKCMVTREADVRLGDCQYMIPKGDIEKFKTKLISMLRFSMFDKTGNMIYSNVSPYSEKNSKDFLYQFNCVLTN